MTVYLSSLFKCCLINTFVLDSRRKSLSGKTRSRAYCSAFYVSQSLYSAISGVAAEPARRFRS